MPERKSHNNDVKHDLLKTIVAYSATGLLGAAFAYGVSAFDRLPSRALTILPAGIHVIDGPILGCDDAEFIQSRVNAYVDPAISLPMCDLLLSKAQADALVQGLASARQFYQAERLRYFQLAQARLAAIAKAPPTPDQQLRQSVLAAIGDLQYISQQTPEGLTGTALLVWAQGRVDTVLTDVTKEFGRIQSILNKIGGGGARAQHTEFYFVATNASDIEFYVSTSCEVRENKRSARLTLEKVDRDDVLSSALVYVPLLPGRGKLLKYAPQNEKDATALLSSKGTAVLSCTLASGKAIATKSFDPTPFTVTESTFGKP